MPGGSMGGGLFGALSDYKILNLLAVAFPSKAATTSRANEFYDKVIAYTKLGIQDRLKSGFSPDTWADSLPRRYLILSIVLPAVGKSIQSRDQHDMEVAGTRLMLAVEIYRAEHGGPPERLEDLVPGVLPALPSDPISGAGFGYKRLAPGEDPDGRTYLLYSFGADRIDNGGKPAAKEYEALQPRKAMGTDYVLNPVRKNTPPKPE